MAKHPQIRKFEPGASAVGLDQFMQARGFKIQSGNGDAIRFTGPKGGRPVTMRRKHFIAKFLDEERIKAGLEPIIKPRSTNGK